MTEESSSALTLQSILMFSDVLNDTEKICVWFWKKGYQQN